MNRLFLALDGDNAGSHVGQAVLMDDVQGLHDVSNKIKAAAKAVEDMIVSLGGQVISSGGDEITAMMDPSAEQNLEEMRAKFQEVCGFSCTMGVGNTLSQAGKSLIAGKLSGKDQVKRYDEGVEDTLQQAHEANMAGTADEEQSKMDDHYIDAISHDDVDQMDDQSFEEDYGQPDDGAQHEEEAQPEDGSEYEESDEDVHSMMQAPESEDSEYSEEEMLPEDGTSEEFNYEENPELENPDQQDDMEAQPQDDMDFNQDEQEGSEFQEEQPIELDGEEIVENLTSDGSEAEKDEMQEDPEMIQDDGSDLESELADDQGNDDIMQRIAQNLEAFKQNKELIEQLKDQNPELYSSVLNLIQNMVEMARMISPEEAPQEEQMEEPAMEEDQQQVMVPSPNQGVPPQGPK